MDLSSPPTPTHSFCPFILLNPLFLRPPLGDETPWSHNEKFIATNRPRSFRVFDLPPASRVRCPAFCARKGNTRQ